MESGMKLHISESTWREMPCIRGVAKLSYKRDGKTRHIQKTWIARGELFVVKREEVEVTFKAQAARWEQQTLERLKNGEKPDLTQVELSEKCQP